MVAALMGGPGVGAPRGPLGLKYTAMDGLNEHLLSKILTG